LVRHSITIICLLLAAQAPAQVPRNVMDWLSVAAGASDTDLTENLQHFWDFSGELSYDDQVGTNDFIGTGTTVSSEGLRIGRNIASAAWVETAPIVNVTSYTYMTWLKTDTAMPYTTSYGYWWAGDGGSSLSTRDFDCFLSGDGVGF